MKKILTIFLLVMTIVSVGYSQSGCDRSYIRSKIQDYGECKNVAITKNNGDLMLYGDNGYATTACCPSDLQNALKELNNNQKTINDIVLTENGKWLVLYGANGFKGNGTPDEMWDKIIGDFSDEDILSVTFNDNGDWIIITTEYYSTSDQWIADWLKDGEKSLGELWAACLTDDAMVAVYADGFKVYGNVPEKLKKALRDTDLNVFRLKLAGSAWFFADKNGSYQYDM
jgi:hypothetical protein